MTASIFQHPRLAPRPFALAATGLYVAGIAAQGLLSAEMMARAGVWPFLIAQLLLISVWLGLHVWRLRDAGKGPAAAVGVGLVYALSLALLLMLIAFFTSPDAGGLPQEQPADGSARPLALFLLAILVNPDFGTFTMILKGLILIAFLPWAISLIFSIRTGLRETAA